MKVRVYEDPEKFWNEVAPQLKTEVAKNSLCLGLSYLFRSDSMSCLYQSALFDGETLLGALVLSKYRTNSNLLPTPVTQSEFAEYLLKELANKNLPLTGLVSEKNTGQIYKDLIERAGSKAKVNMVQGLYRCSKVILPKMESKLNFRLAEEKDIEQIGDWIEEFHHEAVPHDPPVIGKELAKTKVDNKMIFVLEQENNLLSMAGWGRDIETTCSVNLVFTPKVLRGRGYASAVTANLTKHLLESGKEETNLYTDMKNPTSNKIYMNIGYEFVCDSIHYGFS